MWFFILSLSRPLGGKEAWKGGVYLIELLFVLLSSSSLLFLVIFWVSSYFNYYYLYEPGWDNPPLVWIPDFYPKAGSGSWIIRLDPFLEFKVFEEYFLLFYPIIECVSFGPLDRTEGLAPKL